MALGIIAINETVETGDSSDLMVRLKSKAVGLRSVTPECATSYQEQLKIAKAKKHDPGIFLSLFLVDFCSYFIIFL